MERVLSNGYSRKGLEGSALDGARDGCPIYAYQADERERESMENRRGLACCQASSNIASNEKAEESKNEREREREREREGRNAW